METKQPLKESSTNQVNETSDEDEYFPLNFVNCYFDIFYSVVNAHFQI
ncbi:Uncharacterized protein APZ42_029798 [Daphnia magna]|uniref:Uncharacterized protein n=1 Tax=Daphnia magna TaxID=35525 RepID=A0A162D473_9CRUS|nr:Uncharacterized protein APZ42_029798 [Daphnia magna]